MYLAIDIGSSYIKSAMIDLSAPRIEAIRSMPAPAFLSESGDARELDPAVLADAVRSIIDGAAQQRTIDGAVFSTQMHGLHLRGAGGKPLTAIRTWQDRRGEPYVAEAEALLAAEKPKTGAHLTPSHTAVQLLTMRNAGDIPTGRLCLVGDAVQADLLGHPVAIHPTVAASSGLFNQRDRCWDAGSLEKLGATRLTMPEIAEDCVPVGHYAVHGQRIPFYPAIGDQQASILGATLREGELMINISTGGQLIHMDDEFCVDDNETRPFFEGKYYRNVTHLPSGRMLNIYIDHLADTAERLFRLGEIDASRIWAALAEQNAATSSEGVHFSASFFGTDGDGAGINGLTPENYRFDTIFLALQEEMADAYRAAYDQLNPRCADLQGVFCAGGVMRKLPTLVALLRDRFGVPMRLSPYQDEALVGLARLAAWYSGAACDLAETIPWMQRLMQGA